jgi:hypothetical protein
MSTIDPPTPGFAPYPSNEPPAGLPATTLAPPAPVAVSPVAIAAGALIAAGSFLPWYAIHDAAYNTVTVYGTDAGKDGTWSLPLGLLLLVVGIIPQAATQRTVRGVAAVVALVVGWILWMDLIGGQQHAQEVANQYQVWVNTGPGLYVIAVGVLCAIIAASTSRD